MRSQAALKCTGHGCRSGIDLTEQVAVEVTDAAIFGFSPCRKDSFRSRVSLGVAREERYGTRRRQQRGVDRYVYERVRDFLVRRHKVARRGTRRFSVETVYGGGLIRLERLPLNASPCALQ
jgi:hypothetical protein